MSEDVIDAFHPAVAAWFRKAFGVPTAPQAQAWPAIRAGRHVLVAAPTGSGKTLAAFLAAIDALVREGVDRGLSDETHIVYVSPLKALSNDIKRNLEAPLAGIRDELFAQGLPDVDIRSWVRTGDTPQSERESMRRRPPHIVVTTPESLYILLTSKSGRQMLAKTRTVIVDEIHALAPNKRGAHLALSLERLQALSARPLTRIGLSATQKPIDEVARFLTGTQTSDCAIVDSGHLRSRDLALELPPSPLEAVMSGEVWEQTYDRLAELVRAHRTTLIFVNTRRLCERAARHLSERLGEEHVGAHHGSLAREQRLQAEQRLKAGALKALVATASLELGIDIGDVDLVCQIGSPRAIATFLQRVGRSGHAVGATPKGRLFPLSRDELVESAALLDCVRRGELDRLHIPSQPLDVVAQQIVAEVACAEWSEDALYALVRRAYPFRELARAEFAQVLQMLAEGFHTRRGRRHAYLHRDAVNGVLHARRGAALTAVTCGGTIPDTADYSVVMEPEARFIGTVNEDFAIESLAGDIFQLGNNSYRIVRVERGTVRVEDAHGQPPTIPFWFGEAPGRSDELSFAVSRLREALAARLDQGSAGAALAWLTQDIGIIPAAAEQITDYLAAARAALGLLPTQRAIVMERFFDESGGMQLVIHSPWGSRVNRAWGLSLRKRFCRKFNFELQAAATEDAIVLSLSTSHSFPLEDVARYLRSASVRALLVQALLAAPMFAARWRWNATVALALPRFRGGTKVPPQLQRMEAEDLLATIFPDQVACGENIVGDREIPDHPLVKQTIDDCLHDAMDVAGLERLLAAIERGEIAVIARDLTEPSPLALEILSARPYAFLDDAPLEERRTQAVMSRRWLDPQTAADLGRLDAAAIARVREEAWPEARNDDELHDALLSFGYLSAAEIEATAGWPALADELIEARRATWLALGGDGANGMDSDQVVGSPHPGPPPQAGEGETLFPPPLAGEGESLFPPPLAGEGEGGGDVRRLCVAAERLPEFQAVFPAARMTPAIAAPEEFLTKDWTREDALTEIVRDRLEGLGPVTAARLAGSLALPPAEIDAALARIESQGAVMRGRFTPDTQEIEWCERRLLARIHRYTVNRLRREIEPVEPRHFLRFLCHWQRVAADALGEGPDAVAAVIAQLEGFEAPAASWETEILPARVRDYDPAWLDELSLAGRVVWLRLSAPRSSTERASTPVRSTPIALLTRRNLGLWTAHANNVVADGLSPRASRVADCLAGQGASFFDELAQASGLLRSETEEALAELTARGLVNSDSFGGLRALLVPSDRRKPLSGAQARGRRRRSVLFGIEDAGRWALIRRNLPPAGAPVHSIEHVARTLLRRYGVVFWRLLEREASWLPPWRELLRCYRRLEARGEIRGGRFVAGISGEQFALPEAVGQLRELKRSRASGAHAQDEWVALSAADPLNLLGIVTPGPRLPALTANRLLYRDGMPAALLAAGEVRYLETFDPAAQWEAHNRLQRRPVPAPLAFLA